MDSSSIVTLVTNVGFPVALCFILLRYVLNTLGDKLDHLESSVSELSKTIKCLYDHQSK